VFAVAFTKKEEVISICNQQRLYMRICMHIYKHTSDQMRSLRNLMGSEVGKVIDHILKIKQSFDSAITVMKGRVENLKEDFQQAKEMVIENKEDKYELKREIEESILKQEQQDALMKTLRETVMKLQSGHGADISLLQRDVDEVNEFTMELSDKLSVHQEEVSGKFVAVESRIGEVSSALTAK
jgi:FtsZ-binding cell division protein ZapB